MGVSCGVVRLASVCRGARLLGWLLLWVSGENIAV